MKLCGIEFESFRGRAGWYVMPQKPVDRKQLLTHWNQLQDLAKANSDSAVTEGYTLFCGLFDDRQKGRTIFAVKNADACELAKEFRVGSHNRANAAVEEKTIELVFQTLSAITQVRKFRPYFIDAAGFYARFDGAIFEREARKVIELLEPTYRNGNESFDSLESDIKKMVEENELHLWWD